MTTSMRSLVPALFRTTIVAFFLSIPLFTIPFQSQAAEQEEADAKDDVSTENNPNLGQMKEQKIQELKEGQRDNSKKEPTAEPDRPAAPTRSETPAERPQRFERPIRPERPHR